jgi:hypothetical protein
MAIGLLLAGLDTTCDYYRTSGIVLQQPQAFAGAIYYWFQQLEFNALRLSFEKRRFTKMR